MHEGDLVSFIKDVKPFNLLPIFQLNEVVKMLFKSKVEKGTIIFSQSISLLSSLIIIYNGELEKFFINSKGEKEFLKLVIQGESYGGISLLLNNKRSVRTVVAVEDSELLLLPYDYFVSLCKRYPQFSEYYTAHFGKRMLEPDYAKYLGKRLTEKSYYENLDYFFTQKLNSIYSKEIAFCYFNDSIQKAAEVMTNLKSGYLLIKDNSESFIGIVTDVDFRNKVILKGLNISSPVSQIMASPVISISGEEYVYEAALLMFKRKVKYLALTNEGKITAVISRNMLLLSQTRSPFIFIQSLKMANSLEELVNKWKQVPYIVNSLLSRGVKAEIVNQIITTVSDSILNNIIKNAIKELGPPPADFIFMVLGSEGRKEQTLKTDQDNAIIYEDTDPSLREMVRTYFLKLAEIISDRLNVIGFPYCEGGFMAKNSKWCHSLSHYKDNYFRWAQKPDSRALLNSVIFFDCRAVYGNFKLITELRTYIFSLFSDSSQSFFYLLAKNALEMKPPLTIFNNFQLINVGEKKNVLNLKSTMRIIVDFARIYALKNRIDETNTGDRLKKLFEIGVLNKEEYQEILQGYYYLMNLRLMNQTNLIIKNNVDPDNFIDPKKHTKIERISVKEIFKMLEKYRVKLSIDFVGSLNP